MANRFIEVESVSAFGVPSRKAMVNVDHIIMITPDEYNDDYERKLSCTNIKMVDGRTFNVKEDYEQILVEIFSSGGVID